MLLYLEALSDNRRSKSTIMTKRNDKGYDYLAGIPSVSE
jgi:hypothetical protein